jgi:hypothetical protein
MAGGGNAHFTTNPPFIFEEMVPGRRLSLLMASPCKTLRAAVVPNKPNINAAVWNFFCLSN